ncbi:MAG TPA: sterol desaturase family protein [Allosphingosinicella sp.]|nr:sterol desaturase family protein [Allosphingosinicella sp.]
MDATGWIDDAQAWLPLAGVSLLLLALLVLETRRPIHRTPREGKGRLVANFGLGAVNFSLFALLPLSSVLPAEYARQEGIGLLNAFALPTAAAVVVTLLARSITSYALHVLAHRVPLLWRMHRVHHSDTAVDLSTGVRHHPFELLFAAACHAAAAVMLGLSVPALIAYEATAVALTFWSHANLRLPSAVERLASFIFVTPAAHHVHHSARRFETDSNYGEVLLVWDWLFGTLHRRDHREVATMPIGLGADHDGDAPSLVRQLALPFRRERGPPIDGEAEAARLG